MTEFKPQSVPSDSWKSWLSKGFSLVTKTWWLSLALPLLAGLMLSSVPAGIALLALPALTGLLLAVFCVAARATDKRVPLGSALRDAAPGIGKVVVHNVAWQVPSFLFISYLFRNESNFISGISLYAVGLEDFKAGSLLMFWTMFFIGIVCSAAGLFLMPLMLFVKGPYLEVSALSRSALRLNPFLLGLTLTGAPILFMAGVLHGATVVLGLPLASAFLYVAYQHVFEGEPPVEVTATQVEPHSVPVPQQSGGGA